MVQLKIIEALYFDPDDRSRYFDVKEVLVGMIDLDNSRLFYDGKYNDIFGDPAKRINKKLKIILEFNYHKYTKVYDENQRIDIPTDLPIEPHLQ